MLSVALGLVAFVGSSALADPPGGSHTNAGTAKDSCEVGAGGVFANVGNEFVTIWQCTIVTSDTDTQFGVPGSHPIQAWTVDVETDVERTEIYQINRSVGQTTWQTISDETDPVGDAVVLACYNHRGHAIEDFIPNPHCQPAP